MLPTHLDDMIKSSKSYLEDNNGLPFEPLELKVSQLPGGELSVIEGVNEITTEDVQGA